MLPIWHGQRGHWNMDLHVNGVYPSSSLSPTPLCSRMQAPPPFTPSSWRNNKRWAREGLVDWVRVSAGLVFYHWHIGTWWQKPPSHPLSLDREGNPSRYSGLSRRSHITAAVPALFVASAPMSSLRLKGLHLSGLLQSYSSSLVALGSKTCLLLRKGGEYKGKTIHAIDMWTHISVSMLVMPHMQYVLTCGSNNGPAVHHKQI